MRVAVFKSGLNLNMFESDDYDQILSQFDFPEVSTNNSQTKTATDQPKIAPLISSVNSSKNRSAVESENRINTNELISNKSTHNIDESPKKEMSPKHTKRKIINSYFDHKSKRKFPGPAGLLNGSFKENKDDSVCQIELLSQDIDFTQNCLQRDSFNSPLWNRLLADVSDWNLGIIDTIKSIKQQAITGNLRRQKADTVTAFIESVDRSITDPLITLRDSTGNIKCTLHRDAWSKFSHYLVSEYCALVLWKPTVLTTGSAFKKHYLNITLSNIFAIYSSAVLNDETSEEMPDGYKIIYEEEFTVIKTDKSSLTSDNTVLSGDTNNFFDGLDTIFDDDVF